MSADVIPWAQRPEGRLILVLSSECSGSPLLRQTLGSHSRLVSPSELFLMRYPDYDSWRTRKSQAIDALLEFFELVGYPKSTEELDSIFATREIADVYRMLFEYLPERGILFDETSAYANEVSTLDRSRPLLPYYIWLIHHPLGVIDTHLQTKDREKQQRAAEGALHRRLLSPLSGIVRRMNGSREALARKREAKWVQQNQNIRRFLDTVPHDQQVSLYLEDLVEGPEEIVPALCRMMGLEVEPEMLAFRGARLARQREASPHSPKQLDTTSVNDWSKRMAEDWLMPHTLQLMKELDIRFLPKRDAAQRRRV